MKKIIAAAVAASVSAVAMADISITGNANYEYFSKTVGGATEKTTNDSDMEVNLQVVGKTGDTSVVANFELTSASATDNSNGGGIDVEDLYMTTKVGDLKIKAGDFASGTTALGGEIDNGGRSFNKVDISTKVGPATVGYAVASSSATVADYNGDAAVVYGSMDVAGTKVSFKDNSDSYTIVGLSGSAGGINYRIENKDNDSTATGDALFYEFGTKIGDMTVSYAAIDADNANATNTTGAITEDDSTVFAQDAHDKGLTGIKQITVGTSIDGTAVKLRAGTRTGGVVSSTTYQDADFLEIAATRPLASGATLTVSYADADQVTATGSTMYDDQTLEIDLSVKF